MSMPPPFDGARPEYPSHAGREAGGSNPFGGVSPTPPGPGGVTGQPPSPTGSWDPQAPSTHQAGPLQGDHRQPFAHGPGYPHWDSRPQPSIAPMAAAPSRRGGKRKWALVGAAVAVVVAIGAGVTVTVISGGSGKNTSTAESQPSAPPVPVGALRGLLLTPAEAAKAVGTNTLSGSEEMGDKIYDKAGAGSIVDGDCVSLMPGTEAKYTGSGYTAVRRQYLVNRPEIDYLTQVVIAFPSAELAEKFIASSEEAWRKCSGRTVNVRYTSPDTPPGPPAFEVIGPVGSNDGMITLRRTREGTGDADGDWGCSIASTARNNIVIEGEVCSRTKDSAVTELVRATADKVTAHK